MLDLPHFRHEIRQLDDIGVSVSPGQYYMHHFGLAPKRLDHLSHFQHLVTDGVVDLIEDDEVVFAALDFFRGEPPGFLHQAHIFRIGFFGADFHKAPPHGNNPEGVLAEPFGRLELAVMPRAFDKLHHQHLEPLAGGPHGRSERRRRLAFPRPRVDDDQALSRFGHSRPPFDSRTPTRYSSRIRIPSKYG